ncbi:response regulator [Stenotrophomonas muris]|uniref:response regulator n=1 Tax=Stenotrophomonas muris TaxID=2963283 RepID=UPI00300F6CF3
MVSGTNGEGRLGSLLVIEDDSDLSGMLKEILTMQGYEVDVVASSSEAFERIATRAFHAAILDIQTQDGASVSVADYLLSHRIPYMFASGVPNPQLPDAHQWATFLQKPYSIRELMSALDRTRQIGIPVLARPCASSSFPLF